MEESAVGLIRVVPVIDSEKLDILNSPHFARGLLGRPAVALCAIYFPRPSSRTGGRHSSRSCLRRAAQSLRYMLMRVW